MMNGAINEAPPHPSIGPWVRDRMKQIKAPSRMTTPTISIRFHRGVLSLPFEYDDPV